MKWVKNFGIKAELLTIYALAKGLDKIKKTYGLPNCVNYKYLDGEEWRTQEYLTRLNRIVGQDVKKWVNKIVNQLSQITDRFESLCRKKKKYANVLELYQDYENFCQAYSYFLGVCDVPIFVEEAVTKTILNELERKKVKDVDRHFGIVTAYLQDSYVNKEEKELLRLAIRARKYENIFKDNKKLQKSALYQNIFAHYQKYAWAGHRLLLGKEHNLNYFIKRVKENINTAEKKLKEIISRQKQKRKLFERTIKRYKLDRNLLDCGQKLIWIRDKRYVGLTRGGFYKRELFQKITKELDLKKEDFLFLLPEEVKTGLLSQREINKNLINQRREGYALILSNGKLSKIITGRALKILTKEKIPKLKELKGNPASPGEVSGRVRIVIKDEEMKKFKAGEILVTNMTTPDYISIMKKAGAIVTDLGGITCHAAIISRELHKPCIIGTEIATRVLKTGDLVEMNANRGIVKIIKRKK